LIETVSVIGKVLKKLKPKTAGGNSQAVVVLGQDTDLDQLMREDLIILFKHSPACPVSWAAHAQVTKFARENQGTPVYMIPVIKERPLSEKIADVTGVDHESPQVIVLREGTVVASASQGEITVESLSEMLSAYPNK
jgi:bacillithiol system protein YtxJ